MRDLDLRIINNLRGIFIDKQGGWGEDEKSPVCMHIKTGKAKYIFLIVHAGIQNKYFLTQNEWNNWQSSQRGACPLVSSVIVCSESICNVPIPWNSAENLPRREGESKNNHKKMDVGKSGSEKM